MRAYPSVQQLKCLLAVTELLNFRSAAERLNLSQPPLSRHIKALEGLVGVRLFERDTHSVVPTEAGTILARQTREILAALDLAIDAAKAAGECPAESLRVGITRVIDPGALPNIDTLLKELGYQGSVSELHATTPRLVEQVSSGRLDLAVVATPPRVPADLTCVSLFHETMVVAVAAGITAPATRLTFDALPRMPLFWLRRKDNPVFHDDAERIFASHGYAPERRPKPAHRDALFSKIAAGEGIAFMPASLTAMRRDGVQYRRFVPEIEATFRLSLQLIHRTAETRDIVREAARALRTAVRLPRGA
jgi:DNA-binding transcriptional LysR family regulator